MKAGACGWPGAARGFPHIPVLANPSRGRDPLDRHDSTRLPRTIRFFGSDGGADPGAVTNVRRTGAAAEEVFLERVAVFGRHLAEEVALGGHHFGCFSVFHQVSSQHVVTNSPFSYQRGGLRPPLASPGTPSGTFPSPGTRGRGDSRDRRGAPGRPRPC